MRANCLVCNAIPWVLSMFFTPACVNAVCWRYATLMIVCSFLMTGEFQHRFVVLPSLSPVFPFLFFPFWLPPPPLLLSFFLFLCLFLVLAFRSFPSPLSFLPFFCFSFFWFDFNLVAFLASNWRIFARGHHGDYGKITLPYSTSFGERTTTFGWISSVDTSYGIRDTCTSTSAISKQLSMEPTGTWCLYYMWSRLISTVYDDSSKTTRFVSTVSQPNATPVPSWQPQRPPMTTPRPVVQGCGMAGMMHQFPPPPHSWGQQNQAWPRPSQYSQNTPTPPRTPSQPGLGTTSTRTPSTVGLFQEESHPSSWPTLEIRWGVLWQPKS